MLLFVRAWTDFSKNGYTVAQDIIRLLFIYSVGFVNRGSAEAHENIVMSSGLVLQCIIRPMISSYSDFSSFFLFISFPPLRLVSPSVGRRRHYSTYNAVCSGVFRNEFSIIARQRLAKRLDISRLESHHEQHNLKSKRHTYSTLYVYIEYIYKIINVISDFAVHKCAMWTARSCSKR